MNYIYKSLLEFCLWCEIPLKLLKVYIIYVQDCSTLPCYAFAKSQGLDIGKGLIVHACCKKELSILRGEKMTVPYRKQQTVILKSLTCCVYVLVSYIVRTKYSEKTDYLIGANFCGY